jgi:transcription termination/antitermination protein NusG
MDLARFNKCWFAIQVRPQREFFAAHILANKGLEQFLPSYKVKRKWSDRQKEIELPLFPGYIFCRFDSKICAPILTTSGVIRIVGINSPIPDDEIKAIQAVSNRVPALPCSYLTIGTKVQVIAGPLAGVQGILVSYRNRHRLVLSVTLLQSSIWVEVDHDNVVPIGGNAYLSVMESAEIYGAAS